MIARGGLASRHGLVFRFERGLCPRSEGGHRGGLPRPARPIAGGKGTAAEKMAALARAGVRVVQSPADIDQTMAQVLRGG
jgi:hypothetical protein